MKPTASDTLKVLADYFWDVPLDRQRILTLLCTEEQEDINQLHGAARKVRKQVWGNEIFFYGFLYFSTYCRNQCRFCQYRQDNPTALRYRKTDAQILESAITLARSGVHLIDLTMGEDPALLESSKGIQRVADLVKQIKATTGLPVMLSPGVVSPGGITAFTEAGTDWFACYQETHHRPLFERLRQGQSYDLRMKTKQTAQVQGMLIEEGILTGVGETLENIADSILAMKAMDVAQARVMTFVPHKDTPMNAVIRQDTDMEQKIISVLRLVFPDRFIPASLDVDGLSGLSGRLDAGANVVTSIVPPEKGFAGVANADLDIDNFGRTAGLAETVLQQKQLKKGNLKTFIQQMKKLKGRTDVGSTAA